jgi:putative FmdB family regulatory protein
MPTYEYRCENGHNFEVFQRMADDPVETCEVCGAPVERVFHPVAVHFKGSGFYTTDYANKGKASDSGSEGSGSSSDSKGKGEGKSEGKSDGKGEGKSESKDSGDSGGKSESSSDKKSKTGS